MDKKKFEVTSSKLSVPRGFTAERLGDGSVRLVNYEKVKTPDDLITFGKSDRYYYGSDDGNTFEIKLNLPRQRVILDVLLVIKTSANNFKIILSNPDGSDTSTLIGYGEVNAYLDKLDKERRLIVI